MRIKCILAKVVEINLVSAASVSTKSALKVELILTEFSREYLLHIAALES